MNTPDDEERELIVRAQSGEAAAFERLATRHAARTWRSAVALCGDRHWAEDLTQETLVEAWRSVSRFDGRCQFSTWLYGILRHRFLKGRRRRYAVNASQPELLDQNLSSASANDRGSPERCAAVSEDAAEVRAAVARLPEAQRLVIELRFFAGATLADIAAAVGCPLGTVKSRLHHALEKLRKMNLAVNLFASGRESRESQP